MNRKGTRSKAVRPDDYDPYALAAWRGPAAQVETVEDALQAAGLKGE